LRRKDKPQGQERGGETRSLKKEAVFYFLGVKKDRGTTSQMLGIGRVNLTGAVTKTGFEMEVSVAKGLQRIPLEKKK